MGDDEEFEVSDDEDIVDRHIKKEVLNLRDQINTDEREVYSERMADPEINYTRQDANLHWAIPVRQYLRSIKRLWTEDTEVQGATYYWEELDLGSIELVPPDTDTYSFSRIRSDGDEMKLKRILGMHANAELPEIREHDFIGLNDVLKTELLSEMWEITVDPTGPPPQQETVQVSRAQPIPKHIMENAVEAADAFLQQADLGLDIEVAQNDAEGKHELLPDEGPDDFQEDDE